MKVEIDADARQTDDGSMIVDAGSIAVDQDAVPGADNPGPLGARYGAVVAEHGDTGMGAAVRQNAAIVDERVVIELTEHAIVIG
jgi:hypothetical protein